jgi:mediator of replication checkpoint protein 1
VNLIGTHEKGTARSPSRDGPHAIRHACLDPDRCDASSGHQGAPEAIRCVSCTAILPRHRVIALTLWRYHSNQPALPARPLQPQSSVSEIEAWSSPSPVSVHEFGHPRIHQDESTETSQRGQHTSGRRSASPFRSTGLLAPISKYKVASAVYDDDDPFRVKAPPSAPKETTADGDADSGSDSDVEMPGIGQILAAKEARESLRVKKDRLHQVKVAALAKQQMRDSTNAGAPLGVGPDSDDDELDVVPDTMHSVAREEAAARAAAGHMRPLTGRTTQLRLAGIAASPQRNAALSFIASTTESPEKRMAAAAQSSFLASLKAGCAKRGAGMTKAELQRMMLHSAEAQSEQLRKEKEEEWVRRGGHVVGVMEAVGEEKVQVLIGEALRRAEGPGAQGDGDDDAGSDDDDDADYIPMEGGRASPQPTTSQDGEDEEEHMPAEEKIVNAAEHPDEDGDIVEAAAAGATEEDSETESNAPDVVRVHHRPGPARPRHTIIGSDDEDYGPSAARCTKEDVHPTLLSLPDLPSPAFTSTASPWPTGNAEPDHNHEHENDPYVSGNETDKENRAVVRRAGVGSAPAHGARVLFDDILSARVGTRAAVQPLPPLQPSVLPADDDPFAFAPSPAKAGEDALRRLASPTPRYPSGKRGLSQMFEEEEGEGSAPVPVVMIQGGGDGEGATSGDVDPGIVGFKPILGGLSQAFEETQVRIHPLPIYHTGAHNNSYLHVQRASGPGMGGLAALRHGVNTELSLTFEAQAAGLQPALEVDDSLRARAAAIFEKEQEYVMEAAQHAQPRASRRELYITENGCASFSTL